MLNNIEMIEKRHVFTHREDKYGCKIRRSEHSYPQVCENDKKIKREIANNNERRRMQSINTGFETLKQLLPMTIDEEKLSKASILQLTARYIQSLLSRLSTLENEIASYKKPTSTLNEDKFQARTSPSPISQEQTRKRRLNSCTTFEASPLSKFDQTTTLGSMLLPCSESCLLTCDGAESDKTLGSLEHLVAAIEQVEGEKFYVGSTLVHGQETPINCGTALDRKPRPMLIAEKAAPQLTTLLKHNHSPVDNNAVMKPTISPYTEKIILAVSRNPHMFEDRDLSAAHILDGNHQSSLPTFTFQLISPSTEYGLEMPGQSSS